MAREVELQRAEGSPSEGGSQMPAKGFAGVRLVAIVCAALVAVAAVVSTTAAAPSKPEGAGAKKQGIPITYMLSFFPSESNAGEYAALDKGYWQRQGLDVKIVPGIGGGVVQQVAAGNVDF